MKLSQSRPIDDYASIGDGSAAALGPVLQRGAADTNPLASSATSDRAAAATGSRGYSYSILALIYVLRSLVLKLIWNVSAEDVVPSNGP